MQVARFCKSAARLARATHPVQAMVMQPRTRRDGLGAGSAGVAPASASSELDTIYSRSIARSAMQLRSWPLMASGSKAVAGCNSEYASSEGQGDAAAYQTRWPRRRVGQGRPCQCQ